MRGKAVDADTRRRTDGGQAPAVRTAKLLQSVRKCECDCRAEEGVAAGGGAVAVCVCVCVGESSVGNVPR